MRQERVRATQAAFETPPPTRAAHHAVAERSPFMEALARIQDQVRLQTSEGRAPAFLPAALALLLCGCASIGPGTVARDRYDYSDSISESWKRQTLLNIVKLRYLDPPVFVDVGQIVAGYSLETAVDLGGQVSSPRENNLSLGVSGTFTDRPTITYTPLTGNQFVKALMTPLPPQAVFFMIQSGWPADGVLQAALVSMNGLKNQETSISGATTPDADFLRVLELLRDIQRSGAVSLRVKQDAELQQTNILTFRSADIAPEVLAEIHEMRRLLRLDPEATEFELVFGGLPSNDRELAVITRSILHVMSTMAAQVEVPAEDVAEGRATPGFAAGDDGDQGRGLLRIQSSADEPDDASVAVKYRGRWFWIDDRDLRSKRSFAFMLLLFTLTDSGQKESLPLITISAQ